MSRWTDSDNLNAREALVMGGPLDGLRIMVNETKGAYRWPDVFDLTGYRFHPSVWAFTPTGYEPAYHGAAR